MSRANPMSMLFLLVCAGVFAVAQLTDPENVRFLAFDAAEFPERWWALLTYGFVHVEWNHIIVNMLILIWVGVWVERLIGSARFTVLVFAAILAGGLTLLARDTAGIGFSAAAAGLLVYYHVAVPWRRELPLRIPNIVLPVVLVAGSVGAIVFGWWPSVGHSPHLAGGLVGLVLLVWCRRHHRPIDDEPLDDEPLDDELDGHVHAAERPGRRAVPDGAELPRVVMPRAVVPRAVQRVRRWWECSSYLTDVAVAFSVVTVASSVMMVAGWDTPKIGTFAYAHLLGRFVIVSAIVALFHLDSAGSFLRNWRQERPSDRRNAAVTLLRQQLPDGPVGRWATTFSALVLVVCIAALVAGQWWEPPSGTALYRSLLAASAVVAALVAVLVAARGVRRGSATSGPHSIDKSARTGVARSAGP